MIFYKQSFLIEEEFLLRLKLGNCHPVSQHHLLKLGDQKAGRYRINKSEVYYGLEKVKRTARKQSEPICR